MSKNNQLCVFTGDLLVVRELVAGVVVETGQQQRQCVRKRGMKAELHALQHLEQQLTKAIAVVLAGPLAFAQRKHLLERAVQVNQRAACFGLI